MPLICLETDGLREELGEELRYSSKERKKQANEHPKEIQRSKQNKLVQFSFLTVPVDQGLDKLAPVQLVIAVRVVHLDKNHNQNHDI